ncbi:hypothetical protein GCM10020219_001710 [Nonomuraea dietziae]
MGGLGGCRIGRPAGMEPKLDGLAIAARYLRARGPCSEASNHPSGCADQSNREEVIHMPPSTEQEFGTVREDH